MVLWLNLKNKKVNLDSRVREVINRNMVDPSPYTFDEAQLQIYVNASRFVSEVFVVANL